MWIVTSHAACICLCCKSAHWPHKTKIKARQIVIPSGPNWAKTSWTETSECSVGMFWYKGFYLLFILTGKSLFVLCLSTNCARLLGEIKVQMQLLLGFCIRRKSSGSQILWTCAGRQNHLPPQLPCCSCPAVWNMSRNRHRCLASPWAVGSTAPGNRAGAPRCTGGVNLLGCPPASPGLARPSPSPPCRELKDSLIPVLISPADVCFLSWALPD